MAFATRRAHVRDVRDVREDLDERTELWYHESRLSCKGFGSWGRAGEARPHVEQNPCTRFGLDLQPLSESCMALCWRNVWFNTRSSKTNFPISIIGKNVTV